MSIQNKLFIDASIERALRYAGPSKDVFAHEVIELIDGLRTEEVAYVVLVCTAKAKNPLQISALMQEITAMVLRG